MTPAMETIFKMVEQKEMSHQDALAQIERLHLDGVGPDDVYALLREFAADEPLLSEHTIFGQPVLLGAAHLSLAVEAAAVACPQQTLAGIRNLIFHAPVIAEPRTSVKVAVAIDEKANGWFFENRFQALGSHGWVQAASGQYILHPCEVDSGAQTEPMPKPPSHFTAVAPLYDRLKELTIVHGNALQTVTAVAVQGEKAWGRLELTAAMRKALYGYCLHPALLDGAIVTGLAGMGENLADPLVPLAVRKFRIFSPTPNQCLAFVRTLKTTSDIWLADITICSDDGRTIVSMESFCAKRIRSLKVFKALASDQRPLETCADKQIGGAALSHQGEDALSLLDRLRHYIAAKLPLPPGTDATNVHLERNFMELGIDSSQLVALAARIETDANIELYPTVFFEYPNINQLAAYLASNFADAFVKKLGQSTLPKALVKETASVSPALTSHRAPAPRTVRSLHPRPDEHTDTEIAIIGMAGRFGGCNDLTQFWEHLVNGSDLIREIPTDRFDYRPYFDPKPQTTDRIYCKWGSFVNEVYRFEADFFNISPREARAMDPQLRLLLQLLYHTADDAGYGGRIVGTHTGMYVGACFHDYLQEMERQQLPVQAHHCTGNAPSMLANRPSFYFDLTGPSFTVDTACSSSLVALHLACEGLRRGDCDMAFVAGVNLILSPWHYKAFCTLGALSPTGRCHSFAAAADGYVPGEGVAAVLLKPLARALADGDRVDAVIKGSAVNHGGYAPSVTAPSTRREARVILEAWKNAGIDPATIGYIEAHGTGTQLGDPVEIDALNLAFQKHTDKQGFCAVGSAKAHIGHTEGAAGIASIIKTVLSFRHRKIPAMPRFDKINPYIRLEGGPLYINPTVVDWKTSDRMPLRAGVSSFGFGGAYAHVLLESFAHPTSDAPDRQEGPWLFVLSAKDKAHLRTYASDLAARLPEREANAQVLAAVARTLQTGREPMPQRLAVVTSDMDTLRHHLTAFSHQEPAAENVYHRKAALRPPAADTADDQNLSAKVLRLVEANDLSGVARQWIAGAEVPWPRLYRGPLPPAVSLPGYPFQGESYQIVFQKSGGESRPTTAVPMSHPLLDAAEPVHIDDQGACFIISVTDIQPVIRDHRLSGKFVLPAVAYLEMVLAAGKSLAQDAPLHPANVKWLRPLMLESSACQLTLHIKAATHGYTFEMTTVGDPHEVLHAKGELRRADAPDLPLDDPDWLTSFRKCADRQLSKTDFYRKMEAYGYAYGSYFQTVAHIWTAGEKVMGQLRMPQAYWKDHDRYVLAPALADGALQLVACLWPDQGPALPFAVETVQIVKPIPVEAYARLEKTGDHEYQALIADSHGKVCALFKGLAFRGKNQRELPAAAPPIPSSVSLGSDRAFKWVQARVIDAIRAVLQMNGPDSRRKPVDIHRPFNNLGVDSVLAIEIIECLNRELAIRLRSTDLFNHATVAQLAGHIHQAFAPQISRHIAADARAPLGQADPSALLVTSDKAEAVHTPAAAPIAVEPAAGKDASDRKASFSVVKDSDVAIIGISGQFPDAPDVETFWRNLVAGKDSIRRVPEERWDVEAVYDADPLAPGKTYCRYGGFLKDADRFDPDFFNISRAEAEYTDPQHRLFLQEAWRALEDAGYADTDMNNVKCGVYVGCTSGDYKLKLEQAGIPVEAHTFTGNSSAILAARIAYFLNLKGPSVPIDTACSSSLVAVHLACESLRAGTIDLAITGGAAVMSTPEFHIMAAKAAMLSAEGKCRSFDDDANGFVPAEAVAAIVLKPLSRALEDNDSIYGVITGSGINQDGRTSGITAPSAASQHALQHEVYTKYAIDPKSITYIEAHSTGTRLGDPIEIQALTQTFEQVTSQKAFCAVGSVKTNIGHTLTAAGVTGLIKVLLCMRHQTLVPSLYFATPSAHIDFKESPFFVNTRTVPWQPSEGIPRQAAVSSYGFSGTNAHLVIREAPRHQNTAQCQEMPVYLIVLSAKTAVALAARLDQLDRWLAADRDACHMVDIAYTLLVGRSHFSFRAAFATVSRDHLRQQIRAVLDSGSAADCFHDNLDENPFQEEPALEALGMQAIDALGRGQIHSTAEYRKKVRLLADLYVKGYILPWASLFNGQKPARISLPTYPFAQVAISLPASNPADAAAGERFHLRRLHPLVHRETSTSDKIAFAASLTAEEFHYQEHCIHGHALLPAAVSIEMARAAGRLAMHRPVVEITGLTWLAPVFFNDNEIALTISIADSNGQTSFALSAQSANQKSTFAKGSLVIKGADDRDAASPKLNLAEIKARCPLILEGQACYARFKARGYQYGPAFQGVKELFCGSHEGLARIELPSVLVKEADRFEVHPVLVDCALQAAMGLSIHLENALAEDVPMPFMLEKAIIHKPLPPELFAHVTVSAGDTAGASRSQVFDIRLTDPSGNVVMEMQRLVGKSKASADAQADALFYPSAAPDGSALVYLEYVWQPLPVDALRVDENSLSTPMVVFDPPPRQAEYLDRLRDGKTAATKVDSIIVVLPGASFALIRPGTYRLDPASQQQWSRLFRELQSNGGPPSALVSFHSWMLSGDSPSAPVKSDDAPADSVPGAHLVMHLVVMLKAFLEVRPNQDLQMCQAYFNPNRIPIPHYEALCGFFHSIFNETDRISGCVVEMVDADQPPERVFDRIGALFAANKAIRGHFRFSGNHIKVRCLRRIDERRFAPVNGSKHGRQIVKPQDVCLITGGAGGLGAIIARYLAAKRKVRLVLTGRYELTAGGRALLDELQSMGTQAVYHAADVTDARAMAAVVTSVKTAFGRLDGVIHCAGCINDRLLVNKSLEDFKAVLAPKVDGLMVLDAVTQREALKFFVAFSSLVGVIGNFGQSDYAYANGFMDAFCRWRETLCNKGVRSGRTVSINWPLWEQGTMQMRADLLERFSAETGIRPLKTSQGLDAFEFVLARGAASAIPLAGEPQKILAFLETLPPGNLYGADLSSDQYGQSGAPAAAGSEKPQAVQTMQNICSHSFYGSSEGQSRQLPATAVQNYLKSLIAATLKIAPSQIAASKPFDSYGFDSFLILKLNAALEKRFGPLPATLFFEYNSLQSLSAYFLEHHRSTLETTLREAIDGRAASVSTGTPMTNARHRSNAKIVPEEPDAKPAAGKDPVVIRKSELPRRTELQDLVTTLFRTYRGETTVARAAEVVSPYLFIGADRQGYIHFGRQKNIVLGFAYTGPPEAQDALIAEFLRHCRKHSDLLLFLSEKRIEFIEGYPFSATPFGVAQRLTDLSAFTLEGSRMRRLRYMVSKFEKAGQCRTMEYKPGSDTATDNAIAAVIDRWCTSKAQVNPLVAKARTEILRGGLADHHRLFLTYLDGVLQNVILISHVSSPPGYLMDLEFYLPDMPLGGLEFAITSIIKQLKSEGCLMFSLGATFGPKDADSPNADRALDQELDLLRRQNIFTDQGNFQFKNKFRTTNTPIYLCRPADDAPVRAVDVLMMIADPEVPESSEHQDTHRAAPTCAPPLPEAPTAARGAGPETLIIDGLDVRRRFLEQAGYNPVLLDHAHIAHDLITDSWAASACPWIERRIQQLFVRQVEVGDVHDALKRIFPFAHALAVASGRQAEATLVQALAIKDGIAVQNLLFPTLIHHLIKSGLTLIELPDPRVFDLDCDALFKGNVDLSALEEIIAAHNRKVVLACVEVGNNASGGYPIALENLKQVKALLRRRQIPLLIDATRILENAVFVSQQQGNDDAQHVWQTVADILSLADYVTASLTKDFGVNKGGMIATNDHRVHERMLGITTAHGSGLNLPDQKLIASALSDLDRIVSDVKARMASTRRLWQGLADAQIPVAKPCGGHCVLIDVHRAVPSCGEYGLHEFLSGLYLRTGIRGGLHNTGMQKNTALNRAIRLAVPVGMDRAQIQEIILRLTQFFKEGPILPRLRVKQKPESFLGYSRTTFMRIDRDIEALPTTVHQAWPQDVHSTVERGEKPALRPSSREGAPCTGIAVIGMSGRYPMAPDLDTFWDNLAAGRDSITEIPSDRWDYRLYYDPQGDGKDKIRSKWGGFIQDIDKFDPLFFNISPREAQRMDPQQRLFLQITVHALEDAGYAPERLVSATDAQVGVFVGATWSEYELFADPAGGFSPDVHICSIASRVSYFFGFQGPSFTVDTHCSSSLTALHLACESLKRKECRAAIAGGVNLSLHPNKYFQAGYGGFLSSDGRCRSFGAGGDGYVPGEGIGAVVLKPLTDAIQSGDRIYGIIKATAINHGGRTNGFSVPNPAVQARLISETLQKAHIHPDTISYIEAHGTGTALGDPIEIKALKRAFVRHRQRKGFCALGSVKSNIGHLEAAAGISQLTKVLLQMRHEKLVPSLHAHQLNPHVNFDDTPFYVQHTLENWQRPMVRINGREQTVPLRAAISSFGVGGSNAHMIVEEYRHQVPEEDRSEAAAAIPELIIVSARTKERLDACVAGLMQFLEKNLQSVRLSDVAYTLQVGRMAMEKRLAVLAMSVDEVIEAFNEYLSRNGDTPKVIGASSSDTGVEAENGEADAAKLREAVNQGDLVTVARQWVAGHAIDWMQIPKASKPRSIQLPPYPFRRETCWIPPSTSARATGERSPTNAVAEVERLSAPAGPSRKDAAETMDDKQILAVLQKLHNGNLSSDQVLQMMRGCL